MITDIRLKDLSEEEVIRKRDLKQGLTLKERAVAAGVA